MPDRIEFFVHGTPKAWKRPGRNRKTGAIFTMPQDKTWRGSIWGQAGKYAPESPLTEPLAVYLDFRFAIPRSWPAWKRAAAESRPAKKRPDIDNLSKSVLDALKGLFYADDDQICRLNVGRWWTLGDCGVQVSMKTLPALPLKKPKEA